MDSKRVTASSAWENMPKSRMKEKARKELWDSLCAVYENEANTDKGQSDMEDIDVNELEKWTVKNPETSMRALTQLAVTNPDILMAFPTVGDADSKTTDNKIYLEHVDESKRKKNLETKKCRCKPSIIKTTSKKLCKHSELMSQKMNSSLSSTRRKTHKKRSEKKDLTRKASVGKYKVKQKVEDQEESQSSLDQNSDKHTDDNLKTNARNIGTPKHNCNLKFHYYSKAKSVSSRPDKRVFKCKLVFKLCLCTESDIVL